MPESRILALAALVGCSSAERTFEQTLPADDITDVFCDIERGDFVFSASNPDAFTVSARTFARGPTRSAAESRAERVRWGATSVGELLDLWGRNPPRAPTAGVDFVVEGPPTLDVEAILLDGDALLYDLTGTTVVTADRISASGLVGTVDLLATSGGIQLDARPEPGDTITLESTGDVVLRLPYGLEYDLEAFPDPDRGSEVTDLGFDRLDASADYVRAVTGSGGVRVEVTVHGGPFTLWRSEGER